MSLPFAVCLILLIRSKYGIATSKHGFYDFANAFAKSADGPTNRIRQSVSAQFFPLDIKEITIRQKSVDANLFVSNYRLELTSTERITEFLRKENEGLNMEDNR